MRKPEDWQEFERLCKKLFGEVWGCPNTIKKNGRSGQPQSGVDIYGIPKGESSYYGIQCKGKDDYTQAQLTEAEIIAEINKAKTFEPSLKVFVIATSANKDVHVETFIRLEDIKSRQANSFEIIYYAWEDLVDLIEENRETYQWYIAEHQFRDKHDVAILINDLEEPVIQPQYTREVRIYKLTSKPDYIDVAYNNILNQLNRSIPVGLVTHINRPTRRQFNYSWCRIEVLIENTGSRVIEDWKLILQIEKNKVKGITEDYDGEKQSGFELAMQIAAVSNQNQTVFINEQIQQVIYRPRTPTLIQKDKREFFFWLQPINYEITSIDLNWQLLARDFNVEGTIKINVEPQIQRKMHEIRVENNAELKPREEVFKERIADKN